MQSTLFKCKGHYCLKFFIVEQIRYRFFSLFCYTKVLWGAEKLGSLGKYLENLKLIVANKQSNLKQTPPSPSRPVLGGETWASEETKYFN